MHSIKRTILFPILFLATLSSQATFLHAQSGRVVVHPQDNGSALVNPGMGWYFYNYDNDVATYTVSLAPIDTVPEFSGVSVVYMRLAWAYLEPQEGHFNWSILDTPMQKWTQAGKQVAFRFTTSEGPEQLGGYATPKWVQDAGAKGHYISNGFIAKSGPEWEPDFNDPVYLAKLSDFLAAAAERYDGNSKVAFIDVGFGLWGEGHTQLSTKIPYDSSTIRRYIDLYKKNFKHTLLIANDDFAIQGRGLGTLGYARDQNLGLRDDSILVEAGDRAYLHSFLSYNFWPHVPVIVEIDHYGDIKKKGIWGDGHLFLQSIEDYHASYASVHGYPREFLQENRELIHKISMRLGYRLQLREISWPATVAAGGSFQAGYSWANVGVAPCLPGGHPALTFEDEKGGITGVFVDDDFDVRELPIGPPGKAKSIARRVFPYRPHLRELPQNDQPLITFNLPPKNVLRPGTYSVYISMGDLTGTPTIALPLDGDDGHRRYRVGTITIVEN